jgi:hypothetical protein
MTSESVILQMIVNRLSQTIQMLKEGTLEADEVCEHLEQIIELGKGVISTPKPLPPLERLSEAGYALIDSED